MLAVASWALAVVKEQNLVTRTQCLRKRKNMWAEKELFIIIATSHLQNPQVCVPGGIEL